jgi:hypothetical protein
MRKFSRLAMLAVASLAATALVAGPAAAQQSHRYHPRPIFGPPVYVFKGTLAADAGASPTSISVNVTGGNRRALRALVGVNGAEPLSFAVDPRTVWVSWAAAARGNAPTSTTPDTMKAGDKVYVRIRGERGLPLAVLLQRPAHQVGDVSAAQAVDGRMFVFYGRAVAVDTTAKTITLNVKTGNWLALNALLGESATQTFHYDDATQFLTWRRGPHTFDPSQIQAGDPVTLRTRATWTTPLDQLTAAPLWKVNDHEPWRLISAAAATGAVQG